MRDRHTRARLVRLAAERVGDALGRLVAHGELVTERARPAEELDGDVLRSRRPRSLRDGDADLGHVRREHVAPVPRRVFPALHRVGGEGPRLEAPRVEVHRQVLGDLTVLVAGLADAVGGLAAIGRVRERVRPGQVGGVGAGRLGKLRVRPDFAEFVLEPERVRHRDDRRLHGGHIWSDDGHGSMEPNGKRDTGPDEPGKHKAPMRAGYAVRLLDDSRTNRFDRIGRTVRTRRSTKGRGYARKISRCVGDSGVRIVLAAVPVSAAEASAEAIVDALQTASGKHKGRASGAKGVCVKGAFEPAGDAAKVSSAKLFAAPATMLGRFSMGGGNPKISDKTKPVTRGFSMRFEGGGEGAEFAFVSAPVFSAKTPEQMPSLAGRRGSPGPTASPTRRRSRRSGRPTRRRRDRRRWLNARPPAAELCDRGLLGRACLHAHQCEGRSQGREAQGRAGRRRARAGGGGAQGQAGQLLCGRAEGAAGKGPAAFDLVAILGEPGDPTDDATAMWPEESRKTVKLGTIRVTAIEPDDMRCRHVRSDASAQGHCRAREGSDVRDPLAGLRGLALAPGESWPVTPPPCGEGGQGACP